MLRKLKQQVASAVNSGSLSEANRGVLIGAEVEQNSEGFLCPLCMLRFISADQLIAHFEGHSRSNEDTNSFADVSSQFERNFEPCQSVITELKLKELQSMIEDEKRYSTELKKELDRLIDVIANQNDVKHGEVPYLMQQLQVLEAGKSLLTQRLLELEKELSGAYRLNECAKLEKEELIDKFNEVSNALTMWKSNMEDKETEIKELTAEQSRYRKEIDECKHHIQNLLTMLDQRPSEDDVRVLRQELIHAQQLMDEITLEKEGEISRHLSTIRELNFNNQKLRELRLTVDQDKTEPSCAGSHIKIIKDEEEGVININHIELLQVMDLSDKLPEESCAEIRHTTMLKEGDVSDSQIFNHDALIEENKELKATIEALELSLEQQKANSVAEIENIEHSWSIKSSALHEKCENLENALATCRRDHTTVEENSKRKSERFRDLEEDFTQEVQRLSDIIDEKTKDIEMPKMDYSLLPSLIEEKTCSSEEKDKLNMNQYTEIKEVVEKLRAVEQKAKLLDEQLKQLLNDSTNNEKRKLLRALDEKENLINALKGNLRKNEDVISKQRQKFEDVIANRAELELTLVELQNIVGEKSKSISDLTLKRKESDERKVEMEAVMRTQEDLIAGHVARFEEISSKTAIMERSLIHRQEEVAELQQQLLSVTTQLSISENRCNDMESSIVLLKEQKSVEVSSRKESERIITAKDSEIEELRTKFHQSEKELDSLKESQNSAISNSEKNLKKSANVTELEEKLQSSESQRMELIHEIESKERFIIQQGDLLKLAKDGQLDLEKSLETKIMEIQDLGNAWLEKGASWQEELETSRRKVEELNRVLENIKEELKASEKSLLLEKTGRKEVEKFTTDLLNEKKKEIKDLKDLEASVKHEKESLLSTLVEKDAQIESLKASLEENQKQIAEMQSQFGDWDTKSKKSKEDLKAIKQRCLKAESDLDFERERAAENKRRFDDVVSAMHDLGRANQTMQVDISNHLNRKWLDDSAAINCKLCSKLFSLTLRKHHCRNCGYIFCGSCTQNTARVPSHKKPVRVCSLCYEEITSR